MDLYGYFLTHREGNILKNIHYFPIYERHFSRFVGHPVTMFEIGTGDGGSCRMWKHYFGPTARIVTIDIADMGHIEEAQIFTRTGDQSDARFLEGLIQEFGPPDIVCDDGSHQMADINASFDALFPRMKNGVYLVEDLDGAYWRERGGGLRNPGSFIERCKNLVDEMNAEYVGGQFVPSPQGENICAISFYHMIVVIEKVMRLNRTMVRTPDPLP